VDPQGLKPLWEKEKERAPRKKGKPGSPKAPLLKKAAFLKKRE